MKKAIKIVLLVLGIIVILFVVLYFLAVNSTSNAIISMWFIPIVFTVILASGFAALYIWRAKQFKGLKNFAKRRNLYLIEKPDTGALAFLPEFMGPRWAKATNEKIKGHASIFGKIRNLLKTDSGLHVFNNIIYDTNHPDASSGSGREEQDQLCIFAKAKTHFVRGKHKIIFNTIAWINGLEEYAYNAYKIEMLEKMKIGKIAEFNNDHLLFLSDDFEELKQLIDAGKDAILEMDRLLSGNKVPPAHISYMNAAMVIDIREGFILVRLNFTAHKFLDQLLVLIEDFPNRFN